MAAKTEILALLRAEEPSGDTATVTEMPNSTGESGIVSPASPILSPAAGPSAPNQSQGKAARQAWSQVLSQVADAWEHHAAGISATGCEPAWIEDDELQAQVRAAILAGDLDRSLAAIAAWRRAWEDAMAAACDLPPALLAAAARLPAQELTEWLDDPPPVRRAAARREFLARADAIIAESDGRRPPPNPTVHDMFAEARARLGSRDLEECSLTIWLRKHAPVVAALWPEAPVDASWLDWRLKVGREHLAKLDEAFAAVTGTTIAPSSAPTAGGGHG